VAFFAIEIIADFRPIFDEKNFSSMGYGVREPRVTIVGPGKSG
jgi:hypothetical protein